MIKNKNYIIFLETKKSLQN